MLGGDDCCPNCLLCRTKFDRFPKSEKTYRFSCRQKSENHKRHFLLLQKLTQSIAEQSNLRGVLPVIPKEEQEESARHPAHACTYTIQFREATWLQPHCQGEARATENTRTLIKVLGTNHQEICVMATQQNGSDSQGACVGQVCIEREVSDEEQGGGTSRGAGGRLREYGC